MKSSIFLKNLKTKSRNFKSKTHEIIRIKHIPSITKEWKNNVYFFNLAKTKNLPVFDYLTDKLISAYFSSCFQIGKYKVKLLKTKKKMFSAAGKYIHKKDLKLTKINKGFTKIFLSKSELNHNNKAVTINFYIYNRKGISYLRKAQTTSLRSQKFFKKFLILSTIIKKNINISNELVKEIKLRKKIILYKLISILEKLKFKFSLNQYKFEEKLLYILANSLTKFYRKKVEFNIINLRSIAYNSDIFTKILTLKSKSKRINPHKTMKFIFNKANIPMVNRIEEKTPIRKKFFKELLLKKRTENKEIMQINKQFVYSIFIYKCLNKIYTFYTNASFPAYTKNQMELNENIFKSIHYKNLGGLRLEIKGRLTWRYRADRARFKARKKGGLRNIDSSYKRLPTIMRRGNEEYNLRYSMLAEKRHVGAFAVKGWISGK